MMPGMRPPGRRVARAELESDEEGVALSFEGPDGKHLTLLLGAKDFGRFRRAVGEFRSRDEAEAQTIELPESECLWGERRKAG